MCSTQKSHYPQPLIPGILMSDSMPTISSPRRSGATVCESCHELNLLISKWVHLFAGERKDTDRRPLTLERHAEASSNPDCLLIASRVVFVISQHVRNMNCLAL